jgi:hypothetical protein
LARTVFYVPSGEIFRISAFSSSQIRQLLAAGRHDQIDAVEDEFFEELLSDLARLIGKRLMSSKSSSSKDLSLSADSGDQIVEVPPAGSVVISHGARRICADKDGLIWLKQAFRGELVFVLDTTRRS